MNYIIILEGMKAKKAKTKVLAFSALRVTYLFNGLFGKPACRQAGGP